MVLLDLVFLEDSAVEVGEASQQLIGGFGAVLFWDGESLEEEWAEEATVVIAPECVQALLQIAWDSGLSSCP